jgi:lipopolysaccharide/colanic/teichoic acid biosynthesis glycosyltransferase
MYQHFIKRLLDFILSLVALIVLSPVLLVLVIIGSIKMRGNPFFTQNRPGKNEEIFKLLKFRTMNNKKDKNGKLLPDEERLTKYGKNLRSSSLDELPELFNIAKGDMSIVGPRPLLVEYLPLYTERQKERHIVKPGLTGLAQIEGRNSISWEQKFEYDLKYIENISLIQDCIIIIRTIVKVVKKSGINQSDNDTMEVFRGSIEK